MKEAVKIPLSNGMYALIDESDRKLVEGYKWHALKAPNNYYAITPMKNRQRSNLKMHRLILDAPKGMEVDHINHDGLDNRRENIRLCTTAQNHANMRSRKNSSSRFKGVGLHKPSGKWVARIVVNRKYVHLGCFQDEEDAAKAYDVKAKEHFGVFSFTNFNTEEA